jgi:hypothetical protein
VGDDQQRRYELNPFVLPAFGTCPPAHLCRVQGPLPSSY